jgi:hypothetical protein
VHELVDKLSQLKHPSYHILVTNLKKGFSALAEEVVVTDHLCFYLIEEEVYMLLDGLGLVHQIIRDFYLLLFNLLLFILYLIA